MLPHFLPDSTNIFGVFSICVLAILLFHFFSCTTTTTTTTTATATATATTTATVLTCSIGQFFKLLQVRAVVSFQKVKSELTCHSKSPSVSDVEKIQSVVVV